MDTIKLMANYFSRSVKTTVFKGVILEDEFKKGIKEKFIEDTMIFIDSDDYHKRYLVLINDVEIPNIVLSQLYESINSDRQTKQFVYQIMEKGNLVKIKDQSGEWKNIDSVFKLKEPKSKSVSVSQINTEEIDKTIESFTVEQLTKYVRRASSAKFCEMYIPHTYMLNIDLITYNEKGILDIYELKRKNVRGYDNIMNVGEYKMLKALSKHSNIIYCISRPENKEWEHYEIVFSDTPDKKTMPASTSYSGKKVQEVVVMEIIQKSND